MSHSDQDHVVVDDDDTPASLVSMPDSGDTGEGGKLKMIVQLVKKCLGVKDIASMYVLWFKLQPSWDSWWPSQAAVLASVTSGANS